MRTSYVPPQTEFFTAKAKLTITSLDEPTLRVPAQYNPKELQLTQPVSWTAATPSSHDALYLSFGGVQPQTTQIEMFFDGFEAKKSVQPTIELLKTLARVRKPGSSDEDLGRPHLCMVTWGTNGMPPLYCVIESIVTKYVMFGDDGTALRATCTVSLKECRRVGKTMITADGHEVHCA